MKILWSTFEFLKIQVMHDYLMDQRRIGSQGQVPPSITPLERVPALNPEPSLPPLSLSVADDDTNHSPATETKSNASTQITFASDPFSTPQQSASSMSSVSTPPVSLAVATRTHHGALEPRRNNDIFMAKLVGLACSGLITGLTHVLQNRPRSPQNTEEVERQWKCVGVSMIGTKHIKKGFPCQDACRLKELPTGELVIAIADGAGSADQAQEGATVAVSVAVNYLGKAIPHYKPNNIKSWKMIVRHSFELAKANLIKYAVDQKRDLKNYATTLQIVIVENNWTVSALIGDGTAIGLDNNGSLISLMTPQRGEYANATNFITSTSALNKLNIEVWSKPVSRVAVLTDGLLNLAVNEKDNTPFPQFFNPLFRFLDASVSEQQAENGLTQFLQSERINRRTDDDKTLVLAQRTAIPSESKVNQCDLKRTAAKQLR